MRKLPLRYRLMNPFVKVILRPAGADVAEYDDEQANEARMTKAALRLDRRKFRKQVRRRLYS